MTDQLSIGEQPAQKTPLKKEKRKLKPGMGKAKGSGFELQIAKKLSAALEPLNFMRTPGSGARTGGKNFEKFGQMFGDEALALFTSDVVPINEKKEGFTFLHSIECKAYKTPDSFPQLVSGTANVFKWIKEAETDAAKINRNPVLIFKWNNINILVATFIPTPCVMLSLEIPNERKIYVSYFDELIKHPEFWRAAVSKE
jgi:hypothetical protein